MEISSSSSSSSSSSTAPEVPEAPLTPVIFGEPTLFAVPEMSIEEFLDLPLDSLASEHPVTFPPSPVLSFSRVPMASFTPQYMYGDQKVHNRLDVFVKTPTCLGKTGLPMYEGVLLKNVAYFDQIEKYLHKVNQTSPFFHHVWYRLNGIVDCGPATKHLRTDDHQQVLSFMYEIGVDALLYQQIAYELRRVSFTIMNEGIFWGEFLKFSDSKFTHRIFGCLSRDNEEVWIYFTKTGKNKKPRVVLNKISYGGILGKDIVLKYLQIGWLFHE